MPDTDEKKKIWKENTEAHRYVNAGFYNTGLLNDLNIERPEEEVEKIRIPAKEKETNEDANEVDEKSE